MISQNIFERVSLFSETIFEHFADLFIDLYLYEKKGGGLGFKHVKRQRKSQKKHKNIKIEKNLRLHFKTFKRKTSQLSFYFTTIS
jgi:hypothetical protein